jgi:periplasmic protein TonB
MYLSEKSVSEKMGRMAIVFGLHGLFAVGLISLGAGQIVKDIRQSTITVIKDDLNPTPQKDKKIIVDEKMEPIDPTVERPIFTDMPITKNSDPQISIDTGGKIDGNTVTGGEIAKGSDLPMPPRTPLIITAAMDKRFLSAFQPPYPQSALRAEVEGTVRLRIIIGIDGKVKSATVAKSSGTAALDEAAVAHALRKWRFTPASSDGTPIEDTREINVIFQLSTTG